jgi:hypothetical protein
VRQGSCEGPILFLFILQAALETMHWPVPKPAFRTRDVGREVDTETRGHCLRALRVALR